MAYLSSLVMRYQGMNGFDWWVFRVKHEAVRLIKASDIPYSIFYPSCFMESLNGIQRVGRFVLVVGNSPVMPWFVATPITANRWPGRCASPVLTTRNTWFRGRKP